MIVHISGRESRESLLLALVLCAWVVSSVKSPRTTQQKGQTSIEKDYKPGCPMLGLVRNLASSRVICSLFQMARGPDLSGSYLMRLGECLMRELERPKQQLEAAYFGTKLARGVNKMSSVGAIVC